jgi:hypothetical protein
MRILLLCGIISIFCLWLLLHRGAEPVKSSAPEVHSSQTNQQLGNEVPVPPAQVARNSSTQKLPGAALAEAEAKYRATPEGSNAFQQRILADWQRPIEFYGKVVDENTNPVERANITFGWSETPDESGEMKMTTQSDAEGLFSLHDKHGPSLEVWVSKEGYYSSHNGQWGFSYMHSNDRYLPDPQNPVIFILHKKGQGVELITSENGMRSDVWVRIPKDNTPVRVDFFQKQVSATGQLEISQDKPPWQDATNWSFRLSIPDGGLVENQDEFQFEAPESGYQPTVEFDFTKGETNWTTQVTKQFYIVFGEPRKYGWLRIESNIAQETVFLTYAINPDGSRNLEPR